VGSDGKVPRIVAVESSHAHGPRLFRRL